MNGVNKAIIVGNVGSIETKHINDSKITNVSLATSESWVKDGEKHERTEWHRVVMFNRLAEIAEQYVTKGQRLYVEGKLQTQSWEKDGQKHYSTEIVVSNMQMLSKKNDVTDDAEDYPF